MLCTWAHDFPGLAKLRPRILAEKSQLLHSQFTIQDDSRVVAKLEIIQYHSHMKSVPINGLKQELASIIAEAEAGNEVLITKHNKPVARLTRPGTEHLHTGAQFGKARLKPAVKGKTAGRYLQLREEDRGIDRR